MYKFKENLSLDDFNSFISENSAPIQQSLSWAKVKNNWTPYLFGIYKEESLCGVSLVLVRKLLPFIKYAYAPRGPIMNFSDKEAVKTFRQGIENFCRRNGIYYFLCDPAIPVGKTLPDISKENYLDPFDIDTGKKQLENMVEAGFFHKGFPKDLHGALQPRYNAVIPLKKADGTALTFAELKKNFKSKIRKYYAGHQAARGLSFEESEDIKTLRDLLSHTEERQNISLRGEEYFRLMKDGFSDRFFLGIEYCTIPDYIKNLKMLIEKGDGEKEQRLKQLSDAEKVISERGEKIPLAALLTVFPENKKGLKIAEYLYAGSDLTVFPSFSATVCGLGNVSAEAINRDSDFLNLGGLSGNFDDGLYEFKKQFSPIIVEYAGEFELKIKKIRYFMMKKMLPIFFRRNTFHDVKKAAYNIER